MYSFSPVTTQSCKLFLDWRYVFLLQQGKRWIMLSQAGAPLSAFAVSLHSLPTAAAIETQYWFLHGGDIHALGLERNHKIPAESMKARAPMAHTNLYHSPSLSKMTTLLRVTSSNPFSPLGRQCGRAFSFLHAEIKVSHSIGLSHKTSGDGLVLNENKERNSASCLLRGKNAY